MKYTNILEKLICLFNVAKTNWFYLGFLIFISAFLIFLKMKKITRKGCFLTILFAYICLLVYVIYNNSTQLGIIGESIIDNLFTNIYFPSIYAYLFAVIVIDIVTLVSLAKVHGSRIYKSVHSIFFFIIQFIMILILDILSKNKIDIFEKASLFSSKDLIMLLELTINTFIAWLITITFIYITNLLTEKVFLYNTQNQESELESDDISNLNQLTTAIDLDEESTYTNNNQISVSLNQNEINSEYNSIPLVQTNTSFTNDIEEVNYPDFNESLYTKSTNDMNIIPSIEMEELNEPKFIKVAPNINTLKATEPVQISSNLNTIETNIPVTENIINNNIVSTTTIPTIETTNIEERMDNQFILNDLVPKKQETVIPQVTSSSTIFEQILNNNLPMIHEEEQEEIKTDNYTLNDYRLFNKILKEIKEHNQNNTVKIDKDLEYRLITKYSTETYNMFKTMLKIYSN